MFDLNAQLGDWKQNFDDVEAIRGSDVKELEQHVRDAVAELAAKGLTQEEAFLIATRRVGDPRPLAVEFKKVNGNHVWAHRAFWMIVGFLALRILSIAVGATSSVGQLIAGLAGGGTITLTATSVCVTTACWLAIVFGLVRSSRDSQGGPLARLVRTRRWQLIGLAAIVPVIAYITGLASTIWLSMFMPPEEMNPIWVYNRYGEVLASSAVFVLLFATAERMRRTTAESTA
jgi:fucose 4-O-acetylase-like acetyltransferase